MVYFGVGMCFIGLFILVTGAVISAGIGGLSEGAPIMMAGVCIAGIGLIIKIWMAQNINVIYTADKVPTKLTTVQSLDACKEYALNYLKGANGYIRCIGEDGTVLWASLQNK